MDAADRLARELELAIRDPHNPTFCVYCVEQRIDSLFTDEKQLHACALHWQQNHHALLTSIMSYMTVARAEDDMTSLEATLLRTSGTCTRRAKHNPVPGLGPGAEAIADAAVRVLSIFVRVCLEQSSKLLRTHLFSRRGVWPRSIDDIIPPSRGPRESLAGLLFWLDRCGRYRHFLPMATFGPQFAQVFRICRVELVPFLKTDDYDMRLPFIDMICQHLDVATSVLRDGSYGVEPAHQRMGAITRVLDAVSLGVGEHAAAWISIVRGEQSRIIDALAAATDAVDARLFPELKDQLLSLQYQMHLTIGLDHRAPQSLVDQVALIHRSMLDVHSHLHVRLSLLNTAAECNAPDCRKHARQTATGKLQRCGACRMYKYCSPDCQKRHWTAQNIPHRRVCKMLRELFAVAQFTLPRPDFVAACKGASFPDTFYQELVGYLCEDVTPGLKAETAAKFRF